MPWKQTDAFIECSESSNAQVVGIRDEAKAEHRTPSRGDICCNHRYGSLFLSESAGVLVCYPTCTDTLQCRAPKCKRNKMCRIDWGAHLQDSAIKGYIVPLMCTSSSDLVQ